MKRFVKPSQGSGVEHGDPPIKHINGLGPNADKLLAKAVVGQQGTKSSIRRQGKPQQDKNLSNEIPKV